MNLQKVEVNFLATFLNEVTKEWSTLKNSPDVFYQRDPNQHTYFSLPHLYLELDVGEMKIEIMKPGDSAEWKEIGIEGKDEEELKTVVQPYLKSPTFFNFPTGILCYNDWSGGNRSIDYNHIKYHHLLDAELLEEINVGKKQMHISSLYYVRIGTGPYKTYRLLSTEEIISRLWFTVRLSNAPGGYLNTLQVEIFSPWYTALFLPKGQSVSIVTFVNGEHWETVRDLIDTKREEHVREVLGKVMTMRKERGDQYYQFFRAWSILPDGIDPIFTPYYGYDNPCDLV